MEVMLAMAILGTIMTIVWASFSSSFKARERVETVQGRYQVIRQGMNRMAKEISMAYLVPNMEETQVLYEIRYKTIFKGDTEYIHFSSFAHQRVFKNEKTSDQAEISYFVETARNADGDLVKCIMRREDVTPDDDPEDGGVKQILIPDIEDFELEYWEEGKEIAGEAWTGSWDTDGENQQDVNDAVIQEEVFEMIPEAMDVIEKVHALPRRVRITVEFMHPLTKKTVTMRTQTQLYLLDPLTF